MVEWLKLFNTNIVTPEVELQTGNSGGKYFIWRSKVLNQPSSCQSFVHCIKPNMYK